MIVVVGILAVISIVAYSGLQDKAYSSKAVAAIDSVTKALSIYKAEAGHYPSTAVGVPVCIGAVSDYPAANGYAEGVCDNTYNRAVSTAFNNELKRYLSRVPDASLPSIGTLGENMRGVVHVSDSSGSFMRLLYGIKGDQTCSRGVKIGLGSMTLCDLQLPAPA